MASEVSICNMALSRIGANSIQSLSDNSKEARECKRFYDFIRDAVMEAHDWGFARKRETLALLSEEYSGWSYAYQYPSDCIAPREITDITGAYTGTALNLDRDEYYPTGKVEFETVANAGLNGKVILTDKEDAELVYTARVTDANQYSSLFVDAFAWRMASELGVPLRGKPQLLDVCMKMYNIKISEAKTSDSRKGYTAPTNDSSFSRSRL